MYYIRTPFRVLGKRTVNYPQTCFPHITHFPRFHAYFMDGIIHYPVVRPFNEITHK